MKLKRAHSLFYESVPVLLDKIPDEQVASEAVNHGVDDQRQLLCLDVFPGETCFEHPTQTGKHALFKSSSVHHPHSLHDHHFHTGSRHIIFQTLQRLSWSGWKSTVVVQSIVAIMKINLLWHVFNTHRHIHSLTTLTSVYSEWMLAPVASFASLHRRWRVHTCQAKSPSLHLTEQPQWTQLAADHLESYRNTKRRNKYANLYLLQTQKIISICKNMCPTLLTLSHWARYTVWTGL